MIETPEMIEKRTTSGKGVKRQDYLLNWIVIVILFTFAGQCTSASVNSPVILKMGNNEVWHKEGDILILICKGDHELIWSHTDHTGTNRLLNSSTIKSSFSQGEHGSTLILRLSLIDAGFYYCQYKTPELASYYMDDVYVNVSRDQGERTGGMNFVAKGIIVILAILISFVIFRWCLLFSYWKRDSRKPTDLEANEQAMLLKKHWEFRRDRLQLGTELGSGAFGCVVKAEAIGLLKTEPSTTVAVKMLKPNADESQAKALNSELKILKNLGMHINIVNLMGACTKNLSKKNELFVMVEYCKNGSLLNYIRRYSKCFVNQIALDEVRESFIDSNITDSLETSNLTEGGNMAYDDRGNFTVAELSSGTINDSLSKCEGTLPRNTSKPESVTQVITTSDLFRWAFETAKGMEYLASRKVIHGDLAARNVLLTENNIVKICDFGLAKELFKEYSYTMSVKSGRFPIKWMAIETLCFGNLSTESDCWAFGVVLWELFSLGKIPYPGIQAGDELTNRLEKGYRMKKPEYATFTLYNIMKECWAHEKKERPSFPELVKRIEDMIEKSGCVDFDKNNSDYVLRNQASDSAFVSKDQQFPELDTYGYLKPNQFKNALKNDSDQTTNAERLKTGTGDNYNVPDPTVAETNM